MTEKRTLSEALLAHKGEGHTLPRHRVGKDLFVVRADERPESLSSLLAGIKGPSDAQDPLTPEDLSVLARGAFEEHGDDEVPPIGHRLILEEMVRRGGAARKVLLGSRAIYGGSGY